MNNDYLKEIERYNTRRKKINVNQCPLLVIDMQNYVDKILKIAGDKIRGQVNYFFG